LTARAVSGKLRDSLFRPQNHNRKN
jgi:hypothetical protein